MGKFDFSDSSDEEDTNQEDKIIPTKGTTFWIYSMSLKMWNQFTNSTESSEDDSMYISNVDYYDIKKGDIVFYYIKNFSKSGFMGVSRADSSQIRNQNNKIKLFKDKNMNNNLIKINYLSTFEKPVKIGDITKSIKTDAPGHRNKTSFISKYIRGSKLLVQLKFNGEQLLSRLYYITDQEDQDSGSDSEDQDTELNTNENSNSSDSDANVVYESESESESESDSESDSEYEGEVPIMIVPCKQFKCPKEDKDQEDYIVDHINNCNKCDITDNSRNGVVFGSVINLSTTEIDIIKVEDRRSIYFNIPLEDYFRQIRHIPKNSDNNKDFIRIARIENGDEIYQGCMLITWKSDNPKDSDDPDE